MSPETVEAFLLALKEAYSSAGWLGLAAILLVAAVNLYQSDKLQALLPNRLRWDTWPVWGRIAFVFFGSGLGALVTGLAGAMAPGAALLSAVGVALTAVLGHRYLLRPAGESALATDLAAKAPSAAALAVEYLTKATAIVLPLDRTKVAEARARSEKKAER